MTQISECGVYFVDFLKGQNTKWYELIYCNLIRHLNLLGIKFKESNYSKIMATLLKLSIVICTFLIMGCQSVSQNRLQYLRAADPSKAQIKIIDHEYFDVQNVSIKSYEEDQTILLDAFSAEKEGMITKQEFNNILSAYNDPARLFCEAKNKFVSYGVYVARNTNRYKCLSEDGKLEQELKSKLAI